MQRAGYVAERVPFFFRRDISWRSTEERCVHARCFFHESFYQIFPEVFGFICGFGIGVRRENMSYELIITRVDGGEERENAGSEEEAMIRAEDLVLKEGARHVAVMAGSELLHEFRP